MWTVSARHHSSSAVLSDLTCHCSRVALRCFNVMHQAPPARHKPSGRFKHAACNVGDRLVVFGGRGVRGYSEGVHVLDTNAGVWTSLQPADSVCPCGREGHTASFVGGKVYVFAGWRGGQFYGDCTCSATVMWFASTHALRP